MDIYYKAKLYQELLHVYSHLSDASVCKTHMESEKLLAASQCLSLFIIHHTSISNYQPNTVFPIKQALYSSDMAPRDFF